MGYEFIKGIRVLDLTMVYAGPMATKMLAELGAEVIKIESAERADVFPRANAYPENQPPSEEPWNYGGFSHELNSGKRGISLSLGTEKGREIFKGLVKISDVVMENFSPRVMGNWGLDYEKLKEIKPDIIMASMSGLGHYGPLRDTYMYMTGMECMSGLASLTGHPDQPPLVSNGAYGDWVSGATGAAAVLTALYHRQVTGRGQYIDVSGREAITSLIGDVMMDATLNKHAPERMGNRHSLMAPHGCYRCKGEDEWINIAVEDDEQWKGFCKALGNQGLAQDERFADALSRRKNQEDLDKVVEDWTTERTPGEAMEVLQGVGVPAGAVLSCREVHLNPHLAERGFFEVVDHGVGVGKRPLGRLMPAKFAGVGSFTLRRAPRFGEANEYVFHELLGMTKEELTKLEEEKVIGGKPVFPPGRPTRTDLIEKQGGQGAAWHDPNYLEELRKIYGEDIGRK